MAEDDKVKIESLRALIKSKHDANLEVLESGGVFEKCSEQTKFVRIKERRLLKGHFGKIYAMHWSGEGHVPGDHDEQGGRCLVSASQDGKLIIWNGYMNCKTHAIPLRSSWVMTCAFKRSDNKFVACGGLDNVCSVYELDEEGKQCNRAKNELSAHDGYLSCCRFLGDSQMVTSSGDSHCMLWDIEKQTVKQSYSDHSGDVMSIALDPTNENIFASASCDSKAKIFDIRLKYSQMSFHGHESDINSVAYFPDGNAIGTGSDDSTCMLWDKRAYSCINKFGHETLLCGITSVDFSKSGRLLFGGYDDYGMRAWGTNDAMGSAAAGVLEPNDYHQNRVSCIGVNVSGQVLCTGSWDTTLRLSC